MRSSPEVETLFPLIRPGAKRHSFSTPIGRRHLYGLLADYVLARFLYATQMSRRPRADPFWRAGSKFPDHSLIGKPEAESEIRGQENGKHPSAAVGS